MKVPFRVRKRPEAEPASAFYLPGSDVSALLALTGRVGGAWPGVHAVAGGFVVVLAQPTSAALPGAVRLRSVTGNLFVPADGELEPGLLDDEAAGLVRSRGLVFLPGGRVLEFDPGATLSPASLVSAGPVRRRRWQTFPQRKPRAERLREILLKPPGESADAIVREGGAGVAEEEPRTEGTGPVGSAAAHVEMGLGRALSWLGGLLRWKKLAELGKDLMRRAGERLPRLLDDVLGRQEAALRQLLKDFRDGNLERALRRALPLGGSGNRGSVPAQDAVLPTHDPRFHLGQVLESGRGPGAVWYGGIDVQAQLADEYRKAAQEAARHGDHRRAAFIYARLLQEHRLAADALARGGFHHEAAIVYLEKLNDHFSAARAFEAAGEFDRAIELYRSRGAHLPAGDLLWKIGEEEQAVGAYRLAARELVQRQGDYLAAGNVMLERARRSDLALDYFDTGWWMRHDVPCLLRLLDLTAPDPDREVFRKAVCSAREWFAHNGADAEAASFCNALVPLAERHFPPEEAEEYRDLALTGLAARLRRRAASETRPGTVVSQLLGRSALWPAALVNDAQAAFRAAVRAAHVPATVELVRHRLGEEKVTAACAAPRSGRVFVGFGNGNVVAFDPCTGRQQVLLGGQDWITYLTTDPDGRFVVALDLVHRVLGIGAWEDTGAGFGPVYRGVGPLQFEHGALSPVEKSGPEPLVVAYDDYWLSFLSGRQMVCTAWLNVQQLGCGGPWEVYPLPPAPPPGPTQRLLIFDGSSLWLYTGSARPASSVPISAGRHLLSGCLVPMMLMLQPQTEGALLSLLLLTATGAVLLARVLLRREHLELDRIVVTAEDGYLAATLLPCGRLDAAAVRRDGIHWLRAVSGSLVASNTTSADLANVAACFHSPLTGELLLLTRDGWLLRRPVPA